MNIRFFKNKDKSKNCCIDDDDLRSAKQIKHLEIRGKKRFDCSILTCSNNRQRQTIRKKKGEIVPPFWRVNGFLDIKNVSLSDPVFTPSSITFADLGASRVFRFISLYMRPIGNNRRPVGREQRKEAMQIECMCDRTHSEYIR